MRPGARRITVVLVSMFLAVMLISASVAGYRTLQSLSSFEGASDPGWRVNAVERPVRIVAVRPDGPAAAALRLGDQVSSINGQSSRSPFQIAELFEHISPGSDYTIVVDRQGQRLEFTLKTGELSRSLLALLPLATLLIPAIFLFTALAVFILRPTDKQAILLALMFGASSGLFTSGYYPGLPGWLKVEMFLATALGRFFWPVFLHFFLIFPNPKEVLSPVLRRFPRLEYYLYVPHLLITLPYTLVWAVFMLRSPEEFVALFEKYRWVGYLVVGLPVAYCGAGLVSLLINYRNASRLLRRKMRVVVAGSLGALLPMMVLIASELLLQEQRISESLLLWLAVIAISAFLLFPLSFVYAIARHQVIPVRLILRRGVRYIFVSQGSIVLELVVVGIVLTALLSYFVAHHKLSVLAVGIVSGIVSISVWQITRYLHYRVIAPVIDRRFFRQAYNAQQILSELGQALRVMASVDEETFALISEKIRAALHADNVSIFLRHERSGDYPCVISLQHLENDCLTVSATPALTLSCDGFVIQRLAESVKPLRVDFEDPQSWSSELTFGKARGDGDRQRETDVLEKIRSALLLPIATKDQLIGVMSLGPRLGDLPYSREDEHLLSAVTWQIAYAIENARLVRQRAEEELLQREIEFATEVQMRLFPQSVPSSRTLDLSGICHPARGVGGDYYDFLTLRNGQIGIAVADVSGKGLSAALLMSTVQASLRTQASFASGRITELVASMNRLLCESTDTSHYATFFYAEYEELTRRLTYVNAGHNPPMLIRGQSDLAGYGDGLVSYAAAERSREGHSLSLATATGSVRLLEIGGPVIGLIRDCVYEHETLTMQRDDVLVAYTDGVSEARNPEGEEFGEERLARVVTSNAHLGADEMRERIVDEVHTWCSGTALHDDLTLVVVRVK